MQQTIVQELLGLTGGHVGMELFLQMPGKCVCEDAAATFMSEPKHIRWVPPEQRPWGGCSLETTRRGQGVCAERWQFAPSLVLWGRPFVGPPKPDKIGAHASTGSPQKADAWQRFLAKCVGHAYGGKLNRLVWSALRAPNPGPDGQVKKESTAPQPQFA